MSNEDAMTDAWSVQDAKAQLSELLRRARGGEAQRIGLSEPCLLISEAAWAAHRSDGLGSWLVETAPRGTDLDLPPRATHRSDPFSDDDLRS